MTEQIPDVLKLVITILLLSILIVAVINVVSMGTAMLNKAVSKVSSGLTSIESQTWAMFDTQDPMSGAAVLSTIDTLISQDVTIVVATKAKNPGKAPGTAKDGFVYGVEIEGNTTAAAGENVPTVKCEVATGSGIASPTSGKIVRGTDTNKFVATLAMKDGLPKLSGTKSGTITQSSKEYISKSGQFRPYLIINQSDANIGVYFEQIR